MGALANEGGLSRGDFGRIDIKPGFSLVELPAELSDETRRKLAGTRISGVLIDLQPDHGPRPSARAGANRHRPGADRPEGGGKPGKKPRHKHS